MRKFYFNNQEDGFFKKTKRKVVPPSPMTGTNFKIFILCFGSLHNLFKCANDFVNDV